MMQNNLSKWPSTLTVGGLALMLIGLTAGPAVAHPLTGGPSTPQQLWVTIVGAVVTLVGVAMALMSSGDSKLVAANRKVFRNGGLAVAAVGLLGFLVAPDLIGPSGCAERPMTGAELTILSPSEGETFDTTEVPVTLEVQGGEIVSIASTENVEGEGHIHISLDGRLTSMLGEAEQTITVEPGEHDLEVEYVANDHAPFCSRIVDRARFSVEPGAE
ncbi:MAG: hypothetical protein WD602_00845 [Actinomycetota bacterium]